MKRMAFAVGLALTLSPLSALAELLDCRGLATDEQREACAAHQAYLDGDMARMVSQVKGTLAANQDPTLQKNLLDLMAAGYRENDGKLPDEVKLPEGILGLKVSVKRRLEAGTGKVRYSIQIAGEPDRLGIVEKVALIREKTNEVLLDKSTKVGEFEESIDPFDNTPWFGLWGDPSPDPIPDGAYRLILKTANGDGMNAVMVLSQMNSSASPVVQSPAPGQVVGENRVTISYPDFHSPEYAEPQKRRITIEIRDAATRDHVFWEKRFEDASEGSVTTDALDDGNYVALVSFREIRKLGSIRLERNSSTYVPFTVKTR
jgi:hypothetical protein